MNIDDRYIFTEDKEKSGWFIVIDTEKWEVVEESHSFDFANRLCKELNAKTR